MELPADPEEGGDVVTDAVKPYAVALSRLLATLSPRSREIKTRVKGAPMVTAGYKVSDPGRPDHIRVEWILGDRFRSIPDDRRLILVQEELTKIQDFLEKLNHPVRRSGLHCSPTRPDAWNWLEVFGKNTKPDWV